MTVPSDGQDVSMPGSIEGWLERLRRSDWKRAQIGCSSPCTPKSLLPKRTCQGASRSVHRRDHVRGSPDRRL